MEPRVANIDSFHCTLKLIVYCGRPSEESLREKERGRFKGSHTRYELPESLRLGRQTLRQTGACVTNSAGRFGRK
jgi:hypothetical protein